MAASVYRLISEIGTVCESGRVCSYSSSFTAPGAAAAPKLLFYCMVALETARSYISATSFFSNCNTLLVDRQPAWNIS